MLIIYFLIYMYIFIMPSVITFEIITLMNCLQAREIQSWVLAVILTFYTMKNVVLFRFYLTRGRLF